MSGNNENVRIGTQTTARNETLQSLNVGVDRKWSLLCWFVAFSIVTLTGRICVVATDVSDIIEYPSFYFYYWLIFTCIFKCILKFIARRIDVLNVNCLYKNDYDYTYNQNIEWYKYISFEMTVEWMVNLLYFELYYCLFIVELTNMDMKSYMWIVPIHVLSEIYHSIIRFSQIYFYLSGKIINCVESNQLLSQNIFISNILNAFRDDSSIDEWRIRHGIDMTVRVLSFLTTCIAIILELSLCGYSYYLIPNASHFKTALLYLVSSILLDVAYFLVVFLINYYRLDFNFLEPFLRIYKSNYKVVLVLFHVSFVFWIAIYLI